MVSYRATPRDGTAWVTGASSGIGRALALALAQEGFRVAVTARRADALEALAREAPTIRVHPGDVTDAAQMRRVVEAIEREGPIALAVLNAGAYDLAAERAAFSAPTIWRAAEANLGGTIRCLDPLLPAMLARGRGQVALVASLAGYGGVPGSVGYGSAKAGLIAMAEGLRLTYARRGLTIQVVNPGFVATAMTAPNPYPMPFMIEPEAAAARIRRGLARGGFEIAFPRRLVWPMKAAGLLPYPLWLAVMAMATRRAQP